MRNLKRLLQKRIIIFDGATGTNLFNSGLLPGESPAWLNLTNPDAVCKIHRAYVEAGSDAILTNTFSVNPLNFKTSEIPKLIKAAVKISRNAAQGRLVVGDIGPLGILLRPYGNGDFYEVLNIYRKIFQVFYQSGIKVFLLETFTSILEAKAAFLAGRDFSEEIMVSFTLQQNSRTPMGEIPETIALTFDKLGAKAVGVNCTTPGVAIDAVKKMANVTNLPIIAKPNAGEVRIMGNSLSYSITDQELAGYFKDLVRAGARFIGGCCGTTPEYIRRISFQKKRPLGIRNPEKIRSYLASPQKLLEITDNSTIIVGERLNPSARKRVREELLAGNYSIYGEEAKAQEEAGADCLDVNAFVTELDESQTLVNSVYEVLKSSQLPLFIDTQNFEAAKKVLEVYPGIGVYNSVPAKSRELKRCLALAKNYGFKVVVSLVGEQIPKDSKDRMANVERALKIARRIGFPSQDLIFDPLVFSAATEARQLNETIKTVSILKRRGLKSILGISNISFGLPLRSVLNSILVTEAIRAGATFLIMNPLDEKVLNTCYGAKALFKMEIDSFLNRSRNLEKQQKAERAGKLDLVEAIVKGEQNSVPSLVYRLLNRKISVQDLIDNYIVRAFNIVGENYEAGTFFIPDLLKSAEAAQLALSILKKYLPKKEKKATVVLATVKGDIHDIGKNIAGMIFESVGYEVIDLGKDVERSKIVEAIKRYKPVALGLSALLTTTMPEMENVIKELRENRLKTAVIIGGPNVTDKYAKKIGAYGAARNALAGLNLLKKIKIGAAC